MLPSGVWSTLITLSTSSSPSIDVVRRPGSAGRGASALAAAFHRMSSTSELLPEPLTPVTTVTTPSGNRDIDVLEVVVPGASDHDRGTRPSGRPAVGRDGDRGRAAEVACRSATSFDFLTFAGDPGRGDLAAAVARAGSEVDQVVGRLDHLAVVLDEDQRVAQVAEVLQSASSKPGVVARMEADRRLVEDVEDARQAAADLAGQADPLALAAGERRRAAGQAQVIEADVDQELEPVADLADEVAGDVLLVAVELQSL